MTGDAPEFSRRVPLARIGAAPFRQEIAASAAECERLARRFQLLALDRLSASVELRRQGRSDILLHAVFSAAFVQESVDTLEPVPGAVEERFALHYGPASAATESSDPADEAAFEPLDGDAIDIGEAVAQEFSLALPQFPHEPGVASGEAGDGAITIGDTGGRPAEEAG